MGARGSRGIVGVILSAAGAVTAACGGSSDAVHAPAHGSASAAAASSDAPMASASAAASATPEPAKSAFVVDSTFGDHGATKLDLFKADNLCQPVFLKAITTPAGMFVIGTFPFEGATGGCNAGVFKISPSGNVDTSFGKKGITPVGDAFGFGTTLVAGQNGAIFAAGSFLADGNSTKVDMSIDAHFAPIGPALATQRIGETSLLLGKLSANGGADNAFNKTGVLLYHGHPGMTVNEVIPSADGSLVLFGVTRTPAINDDGSLRMTKAEAFSAHIKPDGSFDNSFGTKGIAYFDDKEKLAGGFVAPADDGKSIFVGEKGEQSYLFRLTRDMKLDATYGDGGFVATVTAADENTDSDHFDGRDGTTYAWMRPSAGEHRNTIYKRYDASGKLKEAWGAKGVVTFENEPDNAVVFDLPHADGTLLHFVQNIDQGDVFVTRVDANGKIDPMINRAVLGPKVGMLALLFEDSAGNIVALYEDTTLSAVRYKMAVAAAKP